MESRQGLAASGLNFSPDIWQDDGTRMSNSCVTGRRSNQLNYTPQTARSTCISSNAIKPDMRGVKQLDDGIGYIFVRAVLEKPWKMRTRRDVGNADWSPKEIICVEVHAYVAALDCAPHRKRIASCADPGKLRTSCLSFPKYLQLLNQSRAISVYWPTSMR
jgi:hypothetical protein